MSWDSILDKRSPSRRPASRDDNTSAESESDAATYEKSGDDSAEASLEAAGGSTAAPPSDGPPPFEPPAERRVPTRDLLVTAPSAPEESDAQSTATVVAGGGSAAAEPPRAFSYEPEPTIEFESRPLRLDARADTGDEAPEASPVVSVEAHAAPVATTHTVAPTTGPDADSAIATPSPAVPVTQPSEPSPSPAPVAPLLPATVAAPSPVPSTATPGVTTPYTALLAEAAAATAEKKRTKRKRSGGGVGSLLVLLLLAGLVAAGIIYGRPYLFPEEWDESAREYASNIEEIRGVSYTVPLLVIEEPTGDYRARVGNQLLGDWEDQERMWRAVGLSSGGTEREVLDELIVERSRALYYEADGQVYHDASLPTVDKDPVVYRAMAEVAIDQEFRLTAGAASRELLAEAMTDAHVLQQATAIQEASEAPTAIRPPDDATLAFLPPVLDYQLVAPTVFAELLAPYDDVDANPLADTGPEGAGPLYERQLELADPPLLAAGETVVGEATPMSPSFWFMVFASHLDPETAWQLATGVESASLLEVTSGRDACFYSSWTVASGASVSLPSAMSSWVTSAAPELQASLQSAEGAVHLRTCDPGNAFTSLARFGIARELIAFQATELAAVVGVIDVGGDQGDLDEAITAVTRDRAAVSVLALEPTATAAEVSSAAVDAVELIVNPPVVQYDPYANGAAPEPAPAGETSPPADPAAEPVTVLQGTIGQVGDSQLIDGTPQLPGAQPPVEG